VKITSGVIGKKGSRNLTGEPQLRRFEEKRTIANKSQAPVLTRLRCRTARLLLTSFFSSLEKGRELMKIVHELDQFNVLGR
jgi:hypothetical protein